MQFVLGKELTFEQTVELCIFHSSNISKS